MSSSRCWKCLSRPSASIRLPSRTCLRAQAQPFSSSTPFTASPLKQGGRNIPVFKKGNKTLKIKKKNIVKSGRPPAPGERKALRKRIVLSNPNALEIPGLEVLTKELTADEKVEGKVVALPVPVVDQLRAAGAFKPTQGWSAFRRPTVLFTGATMQLGKELEAVEDQENRRTVRRIISGERGAGKSSMLLQAMAIAFLREWVVISIPECQDITMAHTAYAPISDSTPIKYVQKDYTASLLLRIAKANESVLSRYQITQKHAVPIPLQSNISLSRLAELGGNDPDIAWPIFQALWRELTVPAEPNATRPPLMITVDGIGHLMRLSYYRDADFNLIHAHDLSLVQHFTNYLSGAAKLPFGGAILTATSMSNNPSTPTLSLLLRQMEAKASGSTNIPQPSPFETLDERVINVMRDVQFQKISGLTKDETRTLLEYYAASGLLREKVNQIKASERWSMAAGGIVGEIERGAFGMHA